MTLLELLAGLFILSVLLVSLLTASVRQKRQWTEAGLRLRAVEAADQLLQAWAADPRRLPRAGTGSLGSGWRWQTITRDEQALADVDLAVLQLALYAAEAPLSAPPALTVELVVPKEASEP